MAHRLPAARTCRRTGALVMLIAAALLGLLACDAVGTTATPALALAPEGTLLRRVQQRGKMIIGVKYDLPTFGYLDPRTNELQGFDVDLGKAIAREVLGSESRVQFMQARSADRIPFLNRGQLDLVLSTMTASEERARQIDFTDTYYVAGQSLLVRKDSEITGVEDLGGKTVCSVSGSTSEKNIRDRSPRAEVILFSSYSECMQVLDTRRADAVTTDDIILLGFVRSSPDRYRIAGHQFTAEPYAGGVAKGNAEFLDAVNQAIHTIKASGEWTRIYERNLIGMPPPAQPPPADWREVTAPLPKAG